MQMNLRIKTLAADAAGTVPLTPRLVLAIAGLRPTAKFATSVYVDRFNATLAAQAPEFVFARDQD
jgi:hypothetical protein